jgi:cytochrome c553
MKVLLSLFVVVASLAGFAALGQTPAPAPMQPPAQPASPQSVAPAPPVPARPTQLSDFLVFDAEQKEYVAQSGEPQAKYVFELTNIAQEPVTIESVKTSCGCTTAHLPPMPWIIPAGSNGEINVTMNLAGKSGIVFKNVTVSTDKGSKVLLVKVTIMARAGNAGGMGSREMNQQVAERDRQAVFKGDCARCHVARGEGKTGKDLFMADCAICHEAEHRASMVPDLQHLNHETNRELWETWITYGKQGSMMPAFAQSEGGPLSDEQVRTLADYLTQAIPSQPAAPAAK